MEKYIMVVTDEQIKYIADVSIKRLTNRNRLYMHRLRNK